MKLTKQAIKEKLLKRFKNNQYNSLSKIPTYHDFKDIQKATLRVEKAIKSGEKITIIGDYDVDGITSTAIMVDFFNTIGYKIEYIIPNRFNEGYGISPKILNRVDADLIITVDNGISAFEASSILKNKKIDLIITDHHTPLDTLPDAFAIINPKQEGCNFAFNEICGAEVAWYLIASLKNHLKVDYNLKEALSFVSLAIIADIMPLLSLNRTLLKEGLKQIKLSKKGVFLFLNDIYNNIDSQTIGFMIAPRLNSAGRLKDASLSVEFLLSSDYQSALGIWNKLDQLNNKRKELEQEITTQATTISFDNLDNIIVVWGEYWNEGVIGIVASRLVDIYQKPAIVFSVDKDFAKGSARSIGDINIFELIKQNSDLLIGFGGHKGAAGLKIKSHNLDKFKTNINKLATDIPKKHFIPKDNSFGEIDFKICDFELLEILNHFEPYGEENPAPVFLFKNITVLDAIYLGKNRDTLKLTLQDSNKIIDAIKFKNKDRIEIGQKIDFLGSIYLNEFNNTKTLQIKISLFYF